MRKVKSILITMVFICFAFMLAAPMQSQAATKVKINETKLTICVGKKTKLKVEGTTQKVKWTTSNNEIVKVDQKGNIRGLKKGSATITAKVGKKSLKCKVKVKDAVIKVNRTISVNDVKSVTLTYFSDKITCKSSDPDIASVYLTKGEAAEDGIGTEADAVIYGHKSGTTYITVTNNCNNKKMKFKVVVRKKKAKNDYDELLDCIVADGKQKKNGNKYLKYKGAKIEYDYWDKTMDYEYKATIDGATVEWFIMDNEKPEERCMVMWITPENSSEKHYVTVKADPATYANETLVYEEAWYGTPVDETLQKIANTATKKACKYLNALLEEKIDATLKDIM